MFRKFSKLVSELPYSHRQIKSRVRIKSAMSLVISLVILLPIFLVARQSSDPLFASASSPAIIDLSVLSGPTAGGTVITIHGTDFMRSGFTQISSGDSHVCAIGLDLNVYCWGSDWSGQLGDDGIIANQSVPVQLAEGEIPADVTISDVQSGGAHTCGLGSDAKVYCWGLDTLGQLGNDVSLVNQPTPVAVAQGEIPAGVSLNKIVSGRYHTCALGTDSEIYCWGRDNYGQLGNDVSLVNQPTPVLVSQGNIPIGVEIASISAGSYHTCALGSDAKAYCWGWGENGRLGDGGLAIQPTPVAVAQGEIPAGVSIDQITAGRNHTCALGSDAKAYCWGSDLNSELGNDAISVDQLTPVAVAQGQIPAGVNLIDIVAGDWQNCALGSDSKTYCWGRDNYGQLGDGGENINQSVPVLINQSTMPIGVSFRQISGGGYHTCGIGSDYKAYCWGWNNDLQLGDGGINISTDIPYLVESTSLPEFENVTNIFFGAVPASSFTIDSESQLTVVSPAHASGTVAITLIGADGISDSLANFTYLSEQSTLPNPPNTGYGPRKYTNLFFTTLVLSTVNIMLFRSKKNSPLGL